MASLLEVKAVPGQGACMVSPCGLQSRGLAGKSRHGGVRDFRRVIRMKAKVSLLVAANQHPFTRVLGAQRSLFLVQTHDRVHAEIVGESHRGATGQSCAGFGRLATAGVAAHLSVAGRGNCLDPSIV